MSRSRSTSREILVFAAFMLTVAGATSRARAHGEVALINQVNRALHADDRLNGAEAYTAAPEVVVLYGMVFDDRDRTLAEQTANAVNGVTQVVDNIRTKTGKWFQE